MPIDSAQQRPAPVHLLGDQILFRRELHLVRKAKHVRQPVAIARRDTGIASQRTAYSSIGKRSAAISDMQARNVTLPELALIGSTRVALGAGIGLLLAQRINRRQRKAAGLALISVGAITTIPLFMEVWSKKPVAAQ